MAHKYMLLQLVASGRICHFVSRDESCLHKAIITITNPSQYKRQESDSFELKGFGDFSREYKTQQGLN